MEWCSVYFDWVRVGLSNVSAIYQINLFSLDTAVVYSPVILGIKQLLTKFIISLNG